MSLSKRNNFKVDLKGPEWKVIANFLVRGEEREGEVRSVMYGLTGDSDIAVPLKVEVSENGRMYVVKASQLTDIDIVKVGRMPITQGKLIKIFSSELDLPGANEKRVVSTSKKTEGKIYGFDGVAICPDLKPPYFVIAGVYIVSWTPSHEHAIGFLEWGKDLFELELLKYAEFADPYDEEPIEPAKSEKLSLDTLYKATEKAVKKMGQEVRSQKSGLNKKVADALHILLIDILKRQ